MENESIKPKFKVGETAYIMRHSEIKKVIITECYMSGNEINYCCYIFGIKMLMDRISEKYIFKEKSGVILSMSEETGCVDIEWINGNVYKITINETEEISHWIHVAHMIMRNAKSITPRRKTDFFKNLFK